VTVREQVALSGYTTLGLGGPAARFVEADSDEEVLATVRAADRSGEPVLVLGGGSNLVVADEGFPGTVIRMLTRGVRVAADGDAVVLTVAAGEDWDPLVERCVADSLSGLECLSGIPGLVGATPIQNVGAYGQEVAETIVTVRAYDRARDLLVEMANADCGFGYRTSAFKRGAMVAAQRAGLAGSARAGPAGARLTGPGSAGPGSAGPGSEPSGPVSPTLATGRFVVLGVTFRLSRDPLSWPLRYGELASSLGIEPGGRVSLADVRAAVLRLRRRKGMVLDADDPDTRSAGSFFTNPVLDPAQFAALEQAVAVACGPGAQVPRYAAEAGQIKVSAAWLIEKAGFAKGYPGNRSGQAHGPRISTKHTLALVNPGGSSTKELLDLAAEITNGVRETFGVELVREPVLVAAE
jgi:UDP-N-acetylenolpyruvoylglucosamine reductase